MNPAALARPSASGRGTLEARELPGRLSPQRLLAHVAGLSRPGAALVRVRGWLVAVADPVDVVDHPDDLDRVNRLAAPAHQRAGGHDEPPLAAGWVGTLTDDMSRRLLSLPEPDARPQVAPLPPLWLGCYDSAVALAPDGRAWALAADVPGSGPASTRERVERWARRLAADVRPLPIDPPSRGTDPPTSWMLSREAHEAAVRRAQHWISAGDCYQLNLTTQVAGRWSHGGAALAARLWARSPAPHAAYLSLPDGVEAVSISPETFLRVDGRQAAIRPIKGTRPRRADAADDDAQAEALLASSKDHAEHVMIVDLERNDLGRVCATGTVRVPVLAALEAHPSVWHLTSTITGELRADVGVDELLAATFPCGSVVGAPKRMAWQRISELEPVRRGVYCGAVGTLGPHGVELSVGIRTAVVHNGWASYGTGGGIVADSDPAAERQEAVDKARPFLQALRSANG